MPAPIPYPTTDERVTLADSDTVVGAKRLRARSSCASASGKWAWMGLDICISRAGGERPERIGSSRDISAFLHKVLNIAAQQWRERMIVVCLDAGNQPVGVAVVSTGGLSYAQVDVASVFKPAVLLPASAIIIAHNHPSERPEPSVDDIALTRKLREAGTLLGIRVLDHIILTSDPLKYVSFVDTGI